MTCARQQARKDTLQIAIEFLESYSNMFGASCNTWSKGLFGAQLQKSGFWHGRDREISWSASPSRSVTPGSPKVPNVRWTPEMKQALLATLVQKVIEDGLRADSAVWRVSMDKSITIKHCKTKYDICKANYKTYLALKRLSSYSVTEARIIVTDSEQLFDGVLATREDTTSVNNLLTSDNNSTVKPLPSSSKS
ncbi:hypothetical protein K469DRAFT_699293 [Zopfia rhizophila CBS 207.26]|uniref:Myb/SANT-like domain-containing protein n=1 Tax=Zopfia rhizophila CBS 207.26 TaxID=1314779 RepID=A0A6A6EXM5_9PEZI|nr:hypothetical protein K469DRAFT_699293 [Zopfia rhizophila CBS 207.26]